MKTITEVKSDLDKSGLTIAEWAKENGYSYQAVQRVLNGKAKYKRGQSHNIAVTLGLKEGEIRMK